MTIQCIAFDLDDTLWACMPVIQRAEKKHYRWLDQYCPKLTERYAPDAFLKSRQQYMDEHPELLHDLTTLRMQWLRYLLEESNYSVDLAEEAFQIFWNARNQVKLYDGVIEMLERLSNQYILGTISNGNADLNSIGIGHFFEFMLSSREAGVAKPDPAIFQLALQKAGTQPDETVYIGDHPICDVQGANQAGLHSIWYNPSKSVWQGNGQPSQIITHFRQLDAKIELI